jgi:hypothetical protein
MEPNSTYTTTGTGIFNSTNGNYIANITDLRLTNSGTSTASNTVSFSHPINYTSPSITQIMQNKVAVFHVIRDEDEKIIKTEFIKELWVETKNGQSVDFQVARDEDLAEYDANDLVIKVILTVTF